MPVSFAATSTNSFDHLLKKAKIAKIEEESDDAWGEECAEGDYSTDGWDVEEENKSTHDDGFEAQSSGVILHVSSFSLVTQGISIIDVHKEEVYASQKTSFGWMIFSESVLPETADPKELNWKTDMASFSKQPETRQFCRVILLLLRCGLYQPAHLLLMECANTGRELILRDALLSAWFDSLHPNRLLPSSWMPSKQLTLVAENALPYYAACCVKIQDDPDFQRVCSRLFLSLIRFVPRIERIVQNNQRYSSHLLLRNLLHKFVNDAGQCVSFEERIYRICEGLCICIDDPQQFVVSWLTEEVPLQSAKDISTIEKWGNVESMFDVMIHSYLRTTGPPHNFEQHFGLENFWKSTTVPEEAFKSISRACFEKIHPQFRMYFAETEQLVFEVLMPDLGKIVGLYFGF